MRDESNHEYFFSRNWNPTKMCFFQLFSGYKIWSFIRRMNISDGWMVFLIIQYEASRKQGKAGEFKMIFFTSSPKRRILETLPLTSNQISRQLINMNPFLRLYLLQKEATTAAYVRWKNDDNNYDEGRGGWSKQIFGLFMNDVSVCGVEENFTSKKIEWFYETMNLKITKRHEQPT